MKAKPRAPGPDGIHINLLKNIPEDTLKILKEILNKIWTSADFPQQWRAATVIPILKPNKDHTYPLSYQPSALTSCLCKVLERMINTRFIWYLKRYRRLDRSQCGLKKHPSMTDHLISLERYLRDAPRQQVVGLFFDLEKAYETTWQYDIIRDLHRIGLRDRLPVFVSEYLRDRRIRIRIGTILSDEFTISTPGLALRSVREVLPDTHGSNHYPVLTSILPSMAEIQPSYDPSHWVFSRADWEKFHDLCLEKITEDILGEADPLNSFVKHITQAGNESIPRATTIPKKSNPWFDEECREALKARRALDKRARRSREIRGETLSAFRRSQAQARRLFNLKKRQSWADYVSKLSTDTPIKHVWDRVRKISGKTSALPSNI